MNNIGNIEIKFLTRGDDIEMLNQAMKLTPWENQALLGYLAYIKFSIVEQLNIDLPKEEYPIGHPKGVSEEEFEKCLENLVIN